MKIDNSQSADNTKKNYSGSIFKVRGNNIKFISFCILILLFFLTSASSQFGLKRFYIQNVQTGLVIDVKGGQLINGTKVWPYTLNYTTAQEFLFFKGNIPDEYGENSYRIHAGNNLYITVIRAPQEILPAPEPDTLSSGFDRTSASAIPEVASPVNPTTPTRIFGNYNFSIEEKVEMDIIGRMRNKMQIWKIIPVQNEINTFVIQSAQFSEQSVIQPDGVSSGGNLVLASYTGSDLQKWKILPTEPKSPTELELTDFEFNQPSIWTFWKDPKISGKLSWKENSINVKNYVVFIDKEGQNFNSVSLGPNTTMYEFGWESNSADKDLEYCFRVRNSTNWAHYSFSENICASPNSYTPPTTQPPPTNGVGKILISNCHNDKKSVRFWTYDLTLSNGIWVDHGTLPSQWDGSNCPNGLPFEINLTDNHYYQLVAIDCGNLPPSQTQSSCHKLTTPQIQAEPNGSTLVITID